MILKSLINLSQISYAATDVHSPEFREDGIYISIDKPGLDSRISDGRIIGTSALIGTGLGLGLGKSKIKSSSIGALAGTAIGTGLVAGRHLYRVNHHSNTKIKIKPGDLIKITQYGGLQGGHHYAVYAGGDKILSFRGHGTTYNGSGTVYEESLRDLANPDYPLNFKVEPSDKELIYDQIIRNAKEIESRYIGKYHLFDNNCEHWSREVTSGKRYSTQSGGLVGRTANRFHV